MAHVPDSGLNFIIVGASVAGLASAIALKASGHNVTVLEQKMQLGGADSIKRLADNGGPGRSRDYIGLNRWDPELLSEARGEFLLFRCVDLLQMLYNEAIRKPVRSSTLTVLERESTPTTVLFGAKVIDIDFKSCSATLQSGQKYIGDVVIGADGESGIVRHSLMRGELALEALEDSTADKRDAPINLAIIPKTLGVADAELAEFWENRNLGTVWMGSNRGAQTCLGESEDIALWVYTPDNFHQDETLVQDALASKLIHALGPCDPQIQKLAALAGKFACVQLKDHYELESWVSESGTVMVLGEAAHPFPAASLHTYSIALEDGAFLGKIFSHTRNRNRIPEFLHAFEDHRRHRCFQIRGFEKRYIDLITLPDGKMQANRDELMRANHAAGRNVMDGPESDLLQMLDDTRMVFAYEPTDDADEWWMSWGRLRDAAGASDQS
ncbi:hypothetical protein B0H11DRAFT_2246219 [Mycena galericulata]|nr:hypothetical protein B0H11DRAFT_2246219 [Mycena galericulata]